MVASVPTALPPSALLLQSRSITTTKFQLWFFLLALQCNGLVCLRNIALDFLHSWRQFWHQLLLDFINLDPYSASAETKLMLRFIPVQQRAAAQLKNSITGFVFQYLSLIRSQTANSTCVISNMAQFPWLAPLGRSLNPSVQLKKDQTHPRSPPKTNQTKPPQINLTALAWHGGCQMVRTAQMPSGRAQFELTGKWAGWSQAAEVSLSCARGSNAYFPPPRKKSWLCKTAMPVTGSNNTHAEWDTF